MAADNLLRLKSGLTRGLSDVRVALSNPDQEIVAHQLEDTRTTLPVLALFHMMAVISYCDFALTYLPLSSLATWAAAGLAIEAVLLLGYFGLGRRGNQAERAQKVLRYGPFLGFALTLFWLWASVGNARQLPDNLGDAGNMIALAVMFVGAIVAIRLPTTALQFVSGMVVIGVYTSVAALGPKSLLSYIFGVVCLIGFSSVVFLLSASLRRRVQLEKNVRRDGEVIKMLLNEVGSESGDLLWETDADGCLKEFSPRLSEFLHADDRAGPCKNFEQRFFGQHAPLLVDKLAAHQVLRNEEVVLNQGGAASQWQVSAQPIIGDDGAFAGYRGVARDVTAQRLQEGRLAEARDVAQQALDARSQFLAVISHELRTPINAIVGFSEVLSAGQGEHLSVSARREYLGTILESAKHLQGLINEILEATRIERGTITLDEQPNDAAELIEVTAKIVRDQATQAKISVVARVIEDVEVTGDLTRLKQVILNILTNAIKFSPEGGVVNVDMQRGRGGELAILVRDAGIGISEADAERVFEPFVQAEAGSNRRFGGMGLGLSIARRIARLHGGDLTLKGQSGGGTEARFVLPAARVRWPKSAAKTRGSTVAA